MKRLITILVISVSFSAYAEDRLSDAGALIFSGRAAEARIQLGKALSTYRAAKDDPHDANGSLLLGIADLADKDVPAARSDLQYASRKLESINDRFGAWFALLILAQIENDEGQSQAAISLYERSLALLQQMADPARPLSLESLRVFAQISGMPVPYLDVVMGQPKVAKMLFVPFASCMTHDRYGVALMEAGDLGRAEAELNFAADAGSSILGGMLSGMFDSSIQAHMGDLRRRQWRLDEARQSYLKALQSAQELPVMPFPTKSVDVGILGKLAELEVLRGCMDEALGWNDQALAAEAGNPVRVASLIETRGHLLMNGGRFPPAEEAFDEALNLAERIRDVRAQASALSALGSLNFFRGDYGKSAALLEKAIALYDTLGDETAFEETPVFAQLAEDYVMLEAPQSVADVLKRGSAMAEKSGFPLALSLMKLIARAPQIAPAPATQLDLQEALAEWMSSREVRGFLGEDTADLVKSGEHLPLGASLPPLGLASIDEGRKAEKRFEAGDMAGARTLFIEGLQKNLSRDLRSIFLGAVGATYARERNYDDAIPYFEQAIAALESTAREIKVQDQLAGYLGSGRHAYFDLLIEMLLAKNRTTEAFDYAERARSRAFLQVLGNTRVNATHGADPVLTAEAEQLRLQLASLASAGAPAAELEKRQREYEGLMLRVKTSNPEYAALTGIDTLSLDAVGAELPNDTTLISYFVTPLAIHAWVIDRDAFAYVPLHSNRESLRAALCWADDFERTGEAVRGTESLQNPCSGRKATADEVFDLLIAPLQPRIKGHRLILVPHGQLHYIPFAALFDFANDKYLTEEYVLSYAPSASALRFLRRKESPKRGGALVLGDPESSQPALPGASCEAVSVSADLGVIPLLGARATESALHHLDGKIGLVHIASHAGYNASNPLFSSITLAKDNEQNGILEVHEILADLDLAGVNLVVLSSCSTALGKRSSGDEIVGLTRALLYAGSPSVISTLWDISDQASAPLMEAFYRRLRTGEPAADALRGAQITMLQDPQYSDPKYWAGFNLTGDPLVGWK